MTDVPIIAQRIRAARALRKVSQEALAERTQRSARTISNWEAARTQPEASEIAAIAQALDVSADYLLGLADHEHGLQPGKWIVDLDSLENPREGETWRVEIPPRARLVSASELEELERKGQDRLSERPRRGRPHKGRGHADG